MIKVKTPPTLRPTLKPRAVDPLTEIYNRYKKQVLTDEQMQTKASAWVGSQLNPNIDLVKQEAERLRGQAAGRRDAMQAAYMAAAGANQQMAPQILAGFQSAASTLGSLAGAATGQVGAATRADIASQNQALANVGQAPLTGDPAQQQGVESYVGGYLPSANIAQMGAFAQGGFLGQVADQRMRAVGIPWGEYSKTIASLDENELQDLKEIALKKPELVQSVLDKLSGNQEKLLSGMLDVEQERADRRDKLARLKTAAQKLKLEYQKARAAATNDAERRRIDEWYKGQSLIVRNQTNAISQTRADIAQQGVGIAQQNADTARIRADAAKAAATAKASGLMQVPAVIREIRKGNTRATLELLTPTGPNIAAARKRMIDNLFISYAASVPANQRAVLRQMLTAYVNSLRVVKKSSGSQGGMPAAPVKAK